MGEIDYTKEQMQPAADVTEEAALIEDIAMREDAEKRDTAAKSGGIFGILVGTLAFLLFLAVVWMAPVGVHQGKEGFFYTKENNLYYYDGEEEPYLVHKNIAGTGSNHYFHRGWGADRSEFGDWGYYGANVDEMGSFDFYRRNMTEKDAKSQLIDSGVLGYGINKSGDYVAYIKAAGDGMELYCFDGEKLRFISQVHSSDEKGIYLSEDGKYMAYTDTEGMLIAEGEKSRRKLTDKAVNYVLAEEANTLYYVAEGMDTYHLYKYAYDNEEPQLVAENVSYLQLMPNNKDILYAVKPTEVIPYRELIIDDMADTDGSLKEGDIGYEGKLQRDMIRQAMENGEGIQPMMMEYYLHSDDESVFLEDHVVSAMAMQEERNYIVGYKAKDFQPIHLSLVSGGLEMIYYMSLNYGGLEAFLTDGRGGAVVLDGTGIFVDDIKISKDGRWAAYLEVESEEDEEYRLLRMRLDGTKEAEVVADKIKLRGFGFLGDNGTLGYFFVDEDGKGQLSVYGGNTISDVDSVTFAEDVKLAYYISNLDAESGKGQLNYWDGEGEPVTIDGGISFYQYQEYGRVQLMYDYNEQEQDFKLGYYDGRGVTLLDQDVTAIF